MIRLLLITDEMNTENVGDTEHTKTSEEVSEKEKTALDPKGLLAKLQEISPTFRDCKPVALRIDKSIQERFPDLDRKIIRIAMRMHTTSTRYLKAVEKGTHRYDLNGDECGEIAAEHREHAAQTLKERFAEAARRKRDKMKEEAVRQREEVAEQRRVEKLQQLVGRFSRH